MVLSTAFGFPVFFPLIWRWQFAVFKNSEEQAWGVLEAALVGAAVVARADAQSVRNWTGQAIGGVGPVGHPAPIRTLVDVWLAKYDVVWAAGGHPHTVFPTSFDELLRITGGTSADVGE